MVMIRVDRRRTCAQDWGMETQTIQTRTRFRRVAEAVRYLRRNVTNAPSLEDLACHLGVHPSVAQREFRRLVGISAKRFLQDLHARRGLDAVDRGADVLSASLDAGLSGPARLHDHSIRVVALSPGEWKTRCAGMALRWGVFRTVFGALWGLLSPRGIVRLAFFDSDADLSRLTRGARTFFAGSAMVQDDEAVQDVATKIFSGPASSFDLATVATPFQLAVWKALLSLPAGDTTTYRRLAAAIGRPSAARAVGGAVARNPVAVLIPCHRVLREDSRLGGYRWGWDRKLALLADEEHRRLGEDD